MRGVQTPDIGLRPAETRPTDPATLRAQAETILTLLDRLIARPPAAGAEKAEMLRRAVYIHNTIWVGIDLWQQDLLRRVRQSRQGGGFYVFSMTADEVRAFCRRVVPGLLFVAEDMTSLSRDYPALERFAGVAGAVRELAAGMEIYAHDNKAALRLVLDHGFDPLARESLPLPPLPDKARY